jgi:hypothetical protein
MTVDYLYSLVCDPTFIKDVSSVSAQTSVYPNPATNELFIENRAELQSVKIYDVVGRMVHMSVPLHTPSYHVSLQSYPRGMYVVAVMLKGEPLPVVRRILLQ